MRGPIAPRALEALSCPHCASAMHERGGSIVCSRGHSFDRAKQGYVNLSVDSRHAAGADTPEMVEARDRFLRSGWYAPIARALRETLTRHLPQSPPGAHSSNVPIFAEVGAGTGYYLAALLDAAPGAQGIALDLSKPALRHASKRACVTAVGTDVWSGLPLGSGTVDVLLDVFAPRNPQEFARVLSADGVLLTVTPTTDHLRHLRERLGLMAVESDKLESLVERMRPWFHHADSVGVTYPIELDADAVDALVRMGPNAFHLDRSDVEAAVNVLETPFAVTVSVDVSVFSPRTP